MAHAPPGLAQLLQKDLADTHFTEQRMFGGLCYLNRGNMICGRHMGGPRYEVGKDRQGQAPALPGVQPVRMSDRTMAGMLGLATGDNADDARR